MNRIDSTENNTVRNRIKLFNHNLSPLEKRKIPFWLLLAAAARIYLLSRLPFCFFSSSSSSFLIILPPHLVQ
jgi:hypothetical protein